MKKNILHGFLLGVSILLAAETVSAQTTYTSNGSGGGLFSAPSTWNASLSPTEMMAAMRSETNIFVVAEGDVVTVDDSVNVENLTVNGNLVFGTTDDVSHTVIVNNEFKVSGTGKANVSGFVGAHTLLVKKKITSEGEIKFREGTGRAVNVVMDPGSGLSAEVTADAAESKTKFNNFDVASGTVETKSDLRIGGSFTIGSSAVFKASDKTIYIAGNFAKKSDKEAGFTRGTSTIVFNGSTVQSISDAGKLTFYNMTVNGSGFVVVSNNLSVYGYFLVDNESTVSTSAALNFYSDFEVRENSKFESNTDYTNFVGEVDQLITLAGDVTFTNLSCKSTSATQKICKGNINATKFIRSLGKARLVDFASTYQHTFGGATATSTISLQSPMTITGAGSPSLRRSDTTARNGVFSLGDGDITIKTGDVYVKAGDTFKVNGNVTVESGSLVLSGATDKQAEIVGNDLNTLTVANGARLYMRGPDDNFPKNFVNVILGETSTSYYDSKFNQKVHGARYGHLYLDYYDKTFTGDSYIAGHLYMYPMTNGESTVNFAGFSHTLCYHFYDNPDRKGTTSILSTGTITLKSTGDHGQTIYKRTNGTYVFQNLIIENDDPINSQTKTIGGDITVNGELRMTNISDNELLFLALDIDNYVITGSKTPENKFIMGNNTRIKVSGENNFGLSINSFGDVILDKNSLVQFDATKIDQIVPSADYGNIYLYGSTAKIVEQSTTIKGWIDVNGYTPKLTITDPDVTLYVQGNWKLAAGNLNIVKDAKVVFNGDDQEINATTLPNVEFRGSGIKKLKSTVTIEGDLSVSSGCEVDADNRTINLYGDFRNTDGGGGVYHQNAGRLNLRGAVGEKQTIVCTNCENTRLFNVYIERSKTDTVFFESDILVGGNLITAENKGSLNIRNHTLTIGGDLNLYRNCKLEYTEGAKLHFNSSDAEQLIRNYNTSNIYPTMQFTGSAVKRPYDNMFDIDGDVIIDNGAIVSSGVKLKISGNWENSGIFNSSSEVEFDGDEQFISGSAFNNVTIGGTGTKKLKGIVNLTGWLKIDSLATFDVSPNDGGTYYDMTIAGHWYNNIVSPDGRSTGKFVPRRGTVTFIGNSSDIYSGDSLNYKGQGRPGKSFYNVVINTSDPNNYIRLIPIHGAEAKVMTYENDLYVENNFTINTGIFYFYWNKMFVGGNVRNLGGNLSMNGHYDARNILYLGGGEGKELVFDPGTTNTIRQIEINNGALYKLANSYLQYASTASEPRDSIIRIKKGTLWMKDCNITFYEGGSIRIYEEGTLHLDSAAVIQVPSGYYIRNYGVLELLGHANSPAKIQPAAADGTYTLIQEGANASFEADQFCIEGTRTYGLYIKAGTIKGLNNGSFSNSTGNALLCLDGIDLGAGLTADNITFNAKNSSPTYNVWRKSGTGKITFTNYGGTLAGAGKENDSDLDLIIWSAPKGCVWTGKGNDNRWHNPDNWLSKKVPTKDSVVILNHAWADLGSAPYTILIDERAEVKDLTIDGQVTLLLEGEAVEGVKYGLEVFGKLSMMSNSTLVQTSVCDSLILHGSWTCSGTYTHNHIPVVFDISEGSYQLVLHANANIGSLVLRSSDNNGSLSLLGSINVIDSVRLESGTLFANNATINLEGDWCPAGGVFEEGESIVNFCSATEDQHVHGGRFWEIRFNGAGKKIIDKDIAVNRMFRIMSGVDFITAGAKNIYMTGRTTYWYNYVGDEVFEQTGDGAVVFNGGSASIGYIDGKQIKQTSPTKFNNLIIQGSSTKYIRDITIVKGSFEMVANVDVSIDRQGSLVGEGVGSTSTFTQYGGALLIYGVDNFPVDFATYDLNAGSVYYRDSCDYQIVRAVDYNTLYLYNYYFTTYGYKDYSPKILDGDISVRGSLNISDSITTFVVGDHTVTLTGNLSLAENGKQIDWGSIGRIIHNGGSWEVDTDIKVLNNVEKKGTGYLYLNSDMAVNGDIEFDPETRLYMRGYTMTGKPDKTLKLGVNCQLHTSLDKSRGYAFPINFGSYELDETSVTYLEAAADQILYPDVVYGSLYLNNTASRTVDLDGDLVVRGNFYNNQDGTVLNDNGYNLYMRGAVIDLRNYHPTTTTVYLDGDCDQRIYAGGGFTELYLNNLVLAGSGIKDIDETLTKIGGDVTIGENTSFSSDNSIEFGGGTITNNGVFRHYGNTFTFTGKKSHTISMGDNNIFNSFSLVDDDTVNIVGYGITINTGAFSLGKRAKLNMGELTHKIASAQIDLGTDCELVSANASLIFNRNGGQTLPALVCRDIQFSTSGTKTLSGKLTADTLTIDEGVTFSVGSDAKKSNPVTIYGDWICNGSFTSHNDTVFFESKAPCKNRKILSNEQWFSDVVFHRSTKMGATDTSIFKLMDKMMLKNDMVIDTGAVVRLNKNTLVIGNDDTNLTEEPYYPDGEKILVKKGGELNIDAGGTLQFNHMDGYPRLDVYGRLTMVGNATANAVITRSSSNYDTHGTIIIVYRGAKLAAQFYQVQYLAPCGFIINNGAIIDDNNNLSNGIWSNMYTSYNYKNPFQSDDNVKIDTLTYLTVNVDRMAKPIENIAFNHGGTPTVGHHFNIARDTLLPESIELSGIINGAMGFIEYQRYHYVNNNPKKPVVARNIIWPGVSQIIWTGLVSQDWFDRRNWLPMQVPDETISVKIPMTSNAPIIYKKGAACKNLTIAKGSLTVEDFTRDEGQPSLLVNGAVDVQDGSVFAIDNTAEVRVFGDWNIATKGYFVPQNGTVIFAADGGSVSIVPRKSEFNNVKFVGKATYMFTGTTIDFNGDFIVNKGLIWPSTPDYTYNIGGNYYVDPDNGGFNSDVTGYVKFVGGDQTIENGKFNRVVFSNTGDKLLSGTFDVVYNNSTRTARTVIVEGTAVMKAASGCSLTLKGNVLIESGAGFDDGNNEHTFTGYYWESTGHYFGNGKLKFNANHGQYIWGGTFHDIDMTLNTKYISADATMTGNLTIEACTLDMLTNHVTGDGTFTMAEKSNIYTRGSNNYPSFSHYEITGASCYSYYNGPMDQTIRAAKYGYLYLNSSTVKTIEGDITVLKNLYFYENGGTLRAGDFNIYVGQHWYNQYYGKFEPGHGRVIFNGNSGNQYAYLGVSTENPFNDIEIDKPVDQQFYASSVDLNLDGSLYVTSGKMHCVSGYRVRIGGDVTVGSSGLITQSGHYELRHPSGDCAIKTNNSILNDLTLNGDCVFTINDDLTVYGNFVLQKGEFNQNHCVATLGNSLDNIAIYGKYVVTAGGKLRIGDGTSLVVKSGGEFEARGEKSNYALITNNGGRYYFTVEDGGTISASYYNFSYLAKQGIIISDGAIINGVLNFSNGVFSNVVSGGVCLDIRNSQDMYGTDNEGRIQNISFPNNPGGGAVNIRKVESASGRIEVYNATGLLAGELYENDPHGIIDWTGDVVYTWTGASTKNHEDWWDSGNWSATLNGSPVPTAFPTADNNVVIPSTAGGSGFYPVIDRDSAFAKRLTIKNGAQLTIKIVTEDPDSIRCALYATSDATIEGTLIMYSAIDTINVGGNWVIGSSGRFTAGEGTVVMSGVGVKAIQNRALSFNNLVIDNNGTMQAQSAMKVGGNFINKQGVFDVTSYDVTVGGSFVNEATFLPQTKTLILTGTAPFAEGESAHKFNPGSSALYNVTVKGGVYKLDGNDLYINRNLEIEGGTFNVNSRDLNLGDGTGVDNVNITGTLNLQRDGKLKMGNNAIINVNTNGRISMIGDVNHEAIVTSQKVNGTYTFNVNGTIAANNYKVERVNASGVHLLADAQIDGTNNMSHGQFVSGTPGGRYLWFENNFGTDDDETVTISNVYFNAGPRFNASRDNDATNGIISFLDAVGVVASHFFEEDDGTPNGGAIRWEYTGDVLQWVGNQPVNGENGITDIDGTRWDNPHNWKNMATNNMGLPTATTQLHIYPVDHGKYPVIYSDNTNKYAEAKGITLYDGASLTLQEGHPLKVADASLGFIIGKNSVFTAYDSVYIKGQFSNAGKFDNGKKSTIVWQSSLNRDIEMNGWPFYNFVVKNDGGATVTFSVEPGKSLVVENDFTIESGTVNCNMGTLEVGGDFTNKNGIFKHGDGTVKLNGQSLQVITSENGPLVFNLLELIGNGKKEIGTDIEVMSNITVGSSVQAYDDVDIICHGDWKRPQSSSFENNFIGGTGWVKFKGNSLQTIGKPESFTNLEIDNSTSSTAVLTTHVQTISGDLNLVSGVFNSSSIVCLGAESEILNYGQRNYINGSIKKVDATGNFYFPVGSNDRYAPIEICDFDGTATYQVSYKSDKPDNQTQLGEFVNRISSKEFWTLSGSDGASLPRVRLYWMDKTLSGIEDFEVLSVVLYTGDKWTRQGEMIKNMDLKPLDPDTVGGHLTSRLNLTAFGKITFGFCYPTITWNKESVSNVYSTKTNWTPSKYTPSTTTNIKVDEVNSNYPTVLAEGHCYDMTITSNGKLKVADNQALTVHGNATIDGTLELGENSTITFLKDVFASNASVFAETNSKVIIGGDVDVQNVYLSECQDLVLVGGDNNLKKYEKKLLDDVTVNGSLSIERYTRLTANNKTINLKGDFTINAAGDFYGTPNLVLCGSSKQKLAITPNKSLYNLKVSNTASPDDGAQIDLGTGIKVTGHLELDKGLLHSASTARLSLGSTATSTLGNVNSYVIGQMEKEGQADFVFPVGSYERLAQIGVSGISGHSYITAEYTNEKPVSVAKLGAGVEKVSHLESWTLGTQGTVQAYVTLYWTDSLYNEINDLESLFVSAFDGSKWVSLGQTPSGSKCNGDHSGHVKSGQLITISGSAPSRSTMPASRTTFNSAATPHVLASSGGVVVTFGTSAYALNPLPIELYSFDASVTPNNDVRLNWSTASEHNNAYFTIEHMFDGKSEIVDTILAQGEAGEGADYSYLHINQQVGTHYYRLHQTDFDGITTEASDWVSVTIESGNMTELLMSVTPNPGKCQDMRFTVSGIDGNRLRYVIADMSGQTLIDRTINPAGMSTIQIDATDWNLQPAMYLIKVLTDNGQTVSKFVVE